MTGRVDQARLDAAAVGREGSLFAADMQAQAPLLQEAIGGARVLVVGGAGSIGGATAARLSLFRPRALHVIDLSENQLAELVRELRGRPQGLPVEEFRALPLDAGGGLMEAFLASERPYDLVLNFAALKHVRSEKDVFSLLRMLDVNVVGQARLKDALARNGHGRHYFAVSTDKAANPTSLMGASKRLMEEVMFAQAAASGQRVTSARFANVAYSNGSLLAAFLTWLARGQPLAVPRATRRYFVTREESAEICLLAALAVPAGVVAFPRLDPETALQDLAGLATRVLELHGYSAVPYEDEAAARRDVPALAARRAWPLLLTPLDTSGEKPYEEFLAQGETAEEVGLSGLLGLRHGARAPALGEVLELLGDWIADPPRGLEKAAIVSAIARAVPGLAHVETGRSLDDRL